MKDSDLYIGYIVSGSFGEGLTFKLNKEVNPENIRIGDFVVVEGKNENFLCVVDDIELKSTTDEVFFDPPVDESEDFGIERLAVSSFVYNEISIFPYLSIPKVEGEVYARSVKTVPSHFAKVRHATSSDFLSLIPKRHAFYIGTPLTSSNKVYIDLERLSMRNTGLFGMTGTGKSFLARILFSGLIKNGNSTLLIFDMHNEHGKSVIDEKGNVLESLASLFPNKVKIFDVSSENKDASSFITIPYSYVEEEDIALVSDLLGFSEKSQETLEIVASKKKNYLDYLLNEFPELSEEEKEGESEQLNVNLESIKALTRHLEKLKHLKYLVNSNEESAITSIIETLRKGISVVVQFSGEYADDRLTYYFVSNILTRRIFREFSNDKDRKDNSRVTIAIEEAHKFLSRKYQAKNIFGRIAREMRKFNVTLFIIDQRPSEIDSEVLSQIGTRLVMETKDERDIEAVFQGSSHSKRLQKILSTLEQGQALIFGYAVPLPLPVNVRKYDESFIKEMKTPNKNNPIDDIYG